MQRRSRRRPACRAGMIIWLFLSTTTQAQVFQDTLYVNSQSGSNAQSGQSPTSAVATLTHANSLAIGLPKPLLIQLAAGKYTAESWPVSVVSETTIRGAGASSLTVFDAENAAQLLILDQVSNVQLENFSLINGKSQAEAESGSSGGALSVFSSLNCSISNIEFRNNSADEAGGALFASRNTGLRISNCEFINNSALLGGALYIDNDSQPQITNSVFSFNYADSSGGAIFLDSTDALLLQNRIFNNTRNPFRRDGSGGITCFEAPAVIGGALANANDIYDNTGGDRGSQLYVLGDTRVDARYNYWGASPNSAIIHPLSRLDYADSRNVSKRIPIGTRTFYVGPSGSDDDAGVSMQSAWQTLSFGLTQFFSTDLDSMTVLMLPGTYSPTRSGEVFPIDLEDNTSVAAMGAGVIFDGLGTISTPIFRAVGVRNFSLRGMTIQNGRGGQFGAVYGQDIREFAIFDCNFTGNIGTRGGAISFINSRETLVNNCTFSKNTGDVGGALLLLFDGGRFTNNTFFENTASSGGVALIDSNSTSRFLDNYFHHNTADTGGVMMIRRCATALPEIRNNRMLYNSASAMAGAIAIDGTSLPIIGGRRGRGNDIYLNDAPEPGSQVRRLSAGGTIDARNNYWGKIPEEAQVSPFAQFATENFLNLSYRLPIRTRDLYIATDGDDENSGLVAEHPWKTIDYALLQFFGIPGQIITLHLAPGIYSPATNGEILPIPAENHMGILGSRTGESILDGGGSSRLFMADGITGLTLRHLTLRNASAGSSDGGAVYLQSTRQVNIDSCNFEQNGAGRGGAVASLGGREIMLLGNYLTENRGANGGGAIFSSADSLQLWQNRIIDNSTINAAGGGVLAQGGTVLTLLANIIERNTGSNGGGTALIGGVLDARRNQIIANVATGAGGGIYLDSATGSVLGNLEAEGNDLYNNSAAVAGAAVRAINSGDVDARYNYWGQRPDSALVSPEERIAINFFRNVSIALPNGTNRIYFSPAGSDSNLGYTSASPWQRLSTGLQKAFGTGRNPIEFFLLAGNYSSESGQQFPIRFKSWFTLTGASQDSFATVINANRTGRILDLDGVTDVLVRDLALIRGQAPSGENGGALRIRNSQNVRMQHVRLDDNQAPGGYGGGMAIQTGGEISILQGEFDRNRAKAGGAIYSADVDTLILRQSRLEDNHADIAAIKVRNTGFALRNSELTANTSKLAGSAICFVDGSRGSLSLSRIANNTVTDSDTGAAIVIGSASRVYVGASPGQGNDIYGNTGGTRGRAIATFASGVDARYNYWGATEPAEAELLPFSNVEYLPVRNVPVMQNHIPVFAALSPDTGIVNLPTPQEQTFSVSAEDYDNDRLTLVWSVNGGGVGTRSSYTLPARPDGQVDRVEVKVFDHSSTITAVWTVRSGNVTSVENPASSNLPDVYALLPAWPNPFNPQTRFQVELPRQEDIVIGVYDVAGRRIAEIARGPYAAGSHEFLWDGRNTMGDAVASGIYMLKLRAGRSFVAARKLTLLR